MPEMPVTVDVADARLSQIKGWKIASTEASSVATTDRQRRKATTQTEKSNKTLETEPTIATQAGGTCG
jgi:hypothetical protein